MTPSEKEGPETTKDPTQDTDEEAAVEGSVISQHLARRDSIRYLQEFLSSSSFFKLAESIETCSTAEEVEERLAEIAYKIKVIESLLGILDNERKALEKWLERTGERKDHS